MTANQNFQQKKITVADVAEAAGCSASTVSKVLNNHPGISEYLKKKVLETARDLNYGQNRGKLRSAAVILPAPWRFRLDGYVSALLNSIVYVLYQRGIRMEIVLENDLEQLSSRNIDGGISISWEPELTKNWFDLLPLPLIRINSNPAFDDQESLLAHVCMDSRKSMGILLEKLYSLGHRHIVLLAPDPGEIEQRRTRYQGFVNYLRSRHIQHPEKYCIFNMKEQSQEENLFLLKQAVSGGATALIAVDEGAARNALSLIEKLKLQVPERISVISWEQKNVLPYFNPPITGMAMDYTQLSETAVDLLSALCRGERVRDVYFPFQLIERKSIAPVYRRKSGGKLSKRILEFLSAGPASRVQIASALKVKPYSGYFNRTILELLNQERIIYGEKSGIGRGRMLTVAGKPEL